VFAAVALHFVIFTKFLGGTVWQRVFAVAEWALTLRRSP
jgi:hypothetical protein